MCKSSTGRYRLNVVWILSIVLLLFSLAADSGTVGDVGVDDEVTSRTDIVALLGESAGAGLEAESLAKYVMACSDEERSAVGLAAIHHISELLRSENNEVKHFAAISLAAFGPRAIATAPILEASAQEMQRVDDEQLITPPQPSATELYVAIHKITGRPLCEVYFEFCKPK